MGVSNNVQHTNHQGNANRNYKIPSHTCLGDYYLKEEREHMPMNW